VDHIYTDDNVADLLTKPFDAGRFQYLVIPGADLTVGNFFVPEIQHTSRGSVDKVLFTMLSKKRRTVNYRLKMSLYRQAVNKLNEANGINGLDAQEKTYAEDEILAALDLLEPPENFLENQW
nr:hypothetical protein [Tanacetum cinerariifolium]